MKKKLFSIYSLLIVILALTTLFGTVFLSTKAVYAEKSQYVDSDPDDYITEHFDVNAVVTENYIIHITEEIDVLFVK